MKTAIIAVGSAAMNGRAYVSIMAGGEAPAPMCMSVEEARLTASSILQWADHAEARNAEAAEAEAAAEAAYKNLQGHLDAAMTRLSKSLFGDASDASDASPETAGKVTGEQMADAERTLLEERRKRVNAKRRAARRKQPF